MTKDKDVKVTRVDMDKMVGAGAGDGLKVEGDPPEEVGVSVEEVASATPEIIEYRFQRARGISAYRLLRKRAGEKRWTQMGGIYPDYQFMRLAYETDRLAEKGSIEWEDHTIKRIVKG